MSEFIDISHIDQYLALSVERQKLFRLEVKKFLDKNPITHISSDAGCFENLDRKDSQKIEEFINDLISRMTLRQKVNQMSADYSPGIAQFIYDRYNSGPYYAGEDLYLNIPGIKFSDGPSGIVMGYHSTAFPVSMARAATFDLDLERRIGNIIGIEGKSLGANFFGGVCINLLRHPGWGRAQETYGEDPYLLGEMGSALVKGVQHHMMACIKHFAANSIENARFQVDVNMDERTLREVYLPHFKKCIENGAASVMSAYNRFRGHWCGQNEYLLTKILKEDWAFDGFVMSDFAFGIRDTEEAANAGLDVEMNLTQFYGERLVKAVEKGLVDEKKIDNSVRRILRKKAQYCNDSDNYNPNLVGSKAHIQVALEAALKSAVLLKNDNLLPLDRSKIRKILVVGDLAKLGCIGDSKGSSAVFPPYVISAYDGIKEAAGSDIEVDFVRGIVSDEVRQKGKDYDAVILYLGLTHLDEGEYFPVSKDKPVGGDRLDLSLNYKDIDLIEASVEGNSNTLVVLQGGSAIDVEPWISSVNSLIMQWYSGMEGGRALGKLIFGDAVPSGKLPVTFYSKKQNLPYFGKDLSTIDYDYYPGYFGVDRFNYPISFHFGFGLSYTNFEYSKLTLSSKVLEKDCTLLVSVQIKNAGNYDGDEIVQLYIGYVNSRVERHEKDLKAFSRVHLKQGESKVVNLSVPVSDLAYWDEIENTWIVEPITYTVFVGKSSNKADLLGVDFRVEKEI